jgi:cell division protein ZapE
MSSPAEEYERLVRDREIAHDEYQRNAIDALQDTHEALVEAGPLERGISARLGKWLGRQRRSVKGVYLCGPVGRGKTFLMDLFFENLPFADKRRQHFHRFMRSTHEDLKKFRRHANPLDHVADLVASEARIICFDELAVADIADAMILGNLFAALFARNVTLVATSNVQPGDLYKDGLQRQRFLPAIRLIEAHTRIVRLDGPLDFRLRVLERADVFQTPPGPQAEQKLAEYFTAIAPNEGDTDSAIDVLGRRIQTKRDADGAVWFEFAEICDGPRSQQDYIELSRCYHTVLVSNVPQFTGLMENQARRFIALVDEFYDRRVKLIVSAAVPIAELYAGKRLRFEFQRTRSRLEEMQSHDYLAAAHLP